MAAILPLSACSSSSPANTGNDDAAPMDSGSSDSPLLEEASSGGSSSGGSNGGSGSETMPDSGSASDTGSGDSAFGDAAPDTGTASARHDPAYNGIYVPNSQTVKVFALSAQGNVAPIRTLTGPSTMLRLTDIVAVDSQGELFAANEDQFGYTSTLVFPSLANGNVAPIRTLSVSTPMSGSGVSGLAFGPNDDVWIAQYNTHHFPANSTASDGAIGSGPNTGAIAMSAAGELLVATTGGIVSTYAASIDPADAGTAIPTRTLVTGKIIRSIAVANDTIFVLDSTGSIDEFDSGAVGDAGATATIAAPVTTVQNAYAISVDSTANPPVLYVAADNSISGTIYAVPLMGSAPGYTAGTATSIQGPLTTLTSATNLFVVHY